MPYRGDFDLDEIIFFLKERDYSFFSFISDYSDEDAVISMKGTAALYICNVSDKCIPEQTVRSVIDVLEHWDECLEQAYGWLAFWDFNTGTWISEKERVKAWCKESIHDRVKKRFAITEIFFRLDDWPCCDRGEYRVGAEPKEGADTFSIEFRADPLGFNLKFLCEERRLYKIIVHIL